MNIKLCATLKILEKPKVPEPDKGGKKSKKSKKKRDEDDDEDIEKMLAELELEYSGLKPKEETKPNEPSKTDEKPSKKEKAGKKGRKEDFISEEEETEILKLLKFDDSGEEYSSELKHRKVKHYGYEFKYGSNNVNLNEPIKKIPSELNYLWDRLKKYSDNFESDFDFTPDQLTVNCYEPGQGIPPHVDTHSAFEDGILSLSLESSVIMEFKNDKDLTFSILLPRRSLCLMLGESRLIFF